MDLGYIKKRGRINLYRLYGILTSPMRVLPDFIIIGVQKGGSTSFYDYLVQHPNVLPAFKKATKFFDIFYQRGLYWYRSYFPPKYKVFPSGSPEGRFLVGEASQDVIFHPLAPKRVAKVLPNVNLIVLLRNPIDRAYSHYQHRVRIGKEDLSFEEAIEKEPDRLEGVEEKIIKKDRHTLGNFLGYSYRTRGLYADQLERWFNIFPKRQIKVIKSEDFFTETAAVFFEVLDFLNLPKWQPQVFKNSNPGNYPPMNANTRMQLAKFYESQNDRLYKMLGRDLGWEG